MNDNDSLGILGVLFLLGVGFSALWLFTGFRPHNFFSERTELVDYTIVCSVPYQDGKCEGKVRPGLVNIYRINHNNNEVVAQADLPEASLRKLVNCTIFDAENWTCPTVISPTGVSFRDGFPDLQYRTNGTVKHVSGWKHRLHRVLTWLDWNIDFNLD